MYPCLMLLGLTHDIQKFVGSEWNDEFCDLWPRKTEITNNLVGLAVCFLYPVEMIRILPVVWRNKGVKEEVMSYIVFCLRHSNPCVPTVNFKWQDLLQQLLNLKDILQLRAVWWGGGSSKQTHAGDCQRYSEGVGWWSDGVAQESKVWDHIFHHHDAMMLVFQHLFFAEMIASGCQINLDYVQ